MSITLAAIDGIVAGIKLDDLKPAQPFDGAGMIVTVLVVALALACLLTVLAIMLSKPRRPRSQPARPHRGVHHETSGTKAWHRRIDDVVDRFHAGEISRDQAFAQLAALARAYASGMSEDTMETQTLSDLNRTVPTSTGRAKAGFMLLRQTIAALYPPEFADERYNDAARTTSVEQGAEWVSTLVERWRR
ncbi:hypothetical protein [Bifidobacterium apri]|uniref:Uncharacterized protein n=1 Tax=Bifidobacterium apri TaxID=1769423 RepID=A0A6A2VVU2_9BIFI|nr:hypothetical protein [Bifidobacterium apri]KAB8300600.1 hypothetical protein DSM100238_0327 [Bifidobacterium apri]